MAIRAAVLTVSDGVAHGARVDTAGPAVAAMLASIGAEIVEAQAVADERDEIAAVLRHWAQSGIDLVLRGGGTAPAARELPR
jgi:molybdopterin biosynthesis enzyme MoaB